MLYGRKPDAEPARGGHVAVRSPRCVVLHEKASAGAVCCKGLPKMCGWGTNRAPGYVLVAPVLIVSAGEPQLAMCYCGLCVKPLRNIQTTLTRSICPLWFFTSALLFLPLNRRTGEAKEDANIWAGVR